MPEPRMVPPISRRTVLVTAASVVVVAIVVLTVVAVGDSSYERLGRSYPGVFTSLLSALLRLVVVVAGAICMGALVSVVFIVVRKGRDRLLLTEGPELRAVRWSSLIWSVGAVGLVVVDAADANGAPLSRILTPGALAYLTQASYLPGAWIVTAVLAFIIFCAATFIRSWPAALTLLPLGFVALLAPVLVTQVLVGPNHDFGGDAAILGTPAVAVWAGVMIVAALRLNREQFTEPAAVARFLRTNLICGLVAAGTQLIIAAFELAGGSPLTTVTGLLFLTGFLLLAALACLGFAARHTLRRNAGTVPRGPVVVGAILLTVFLAVGVAMSRIPPPQYFVPTSTQQLFLGFDVPDAPTLWVLVTQWRLNILFAVISLVAVALYLRAVRRLRQRGDVWPAGRTISWVLGWAVIFLTTSTGLGKYSTVSFSLHMVLHMSLNMLGPLLLVMGGVITLTLRATIPHRRGEPAGVHEWVTGMLNWGMTRRLYNPLLVFVSFVGSYYLLYLTPIFQEAMRYHWSHQLLNIHFLIGGYLFYSLVIGVDHPPRPLPHIGKLGLVLAAMPFHAFFGVVIMTQSTVIAELFYRYIDAPWMTDLKADQYLGGGIAWSAGELPLIVVVVALVTQWARQDARTAKRVDRHLDSGIDDSFDAYNDMLKHLADRPVHDPRATTSGKGTP